MSDSPPEEPPETDTADVPGGDEGRATARPQWLDDLLLVGGVVVATSLAFGILGYLTGVSLNSIVGFLETVLFFGAVFGLLALALNLHWGYTGLFNIGVAGFMAVGVYTMSIVIAPPDGSPAGLGLPMPVGLVAGMVAAGLVGFVAALPALRVRADYFAIVTLGLSEIIRLSLLSSSLRVVEFGGREYGTGGGSGIRATPVDRWFLNRPSIEAIQPVLYDYGAVVGIRDSVIDGLIYTVVLAVFVVLVYLLLTRIAYSPFGRVLKAIREDELAARSLGKNTDLAKIKVFVLGCALMGLAGALWQGSNYSVNPTSFMPIITFYAFVALIVGGSGSNTGSIVGGFAFAAFLYEGPRFIRTIIRANFDVRAPPTIYDAFVDLGAGDPLPLVGYFIGSLDEIRYILVGVILVVLMIKRPDGLLGHRKEIAAATDLSRPSRAADGGTTTPGEAARRSDGGDHDE